ncbi:zinc-finger domain-containing protein [Nitrosomonas sp.]|uniref:zinc-finger domain-containing protein n=1 Tax=Nitrosomonas sp. TaxID=42353 RepID=UPI0025F9121F|nr:zinc-finger domain-containing protein [Nitrosomonas sp.]
MNTSATPAYPQQVEISPDDLPLHCPNPSMDTRSWHPRVFLEIEVTGEAMCPYCGTHYVLKGTPNPDHHHA